MCNRRRPVDQITCCISSLSSKTLVHTGIGQHAMSLRDDSPVHALGHTILLRSVWDGVMPSNGFFSAIIIKNIRTKFSTIISTQQFHLPFSLLLNHNLLIFKHSKGIIFSFQKIRPNFSRVIINNCKHVTSTTK